MVFWRTAFPTLPRSPENLLAFGYTVPFVLCVASYLSSGGVFAGIPVTVTLVSNSGVDEMPVR